MKNNKSKSHKKGGNKKTTLKTFINDFNKPENLNIIKIIKPNIVPFDLIARLKCFQCGLYDRAILCPPYLFQTYPQFKTIKSTKKFFNSFDYMVIFVFQNDGTKSWKIDKRELSHIDFKKKIAKQLKGTEAGQSREIGRLTRKYSNIFKKAGYKTFGLLPGHCDLCAFKCPNRDHPPCKHKGMPSLEACYIDVYKLLRILNIHYEYPVNELLTGVSAILITENYDKN